MLGETPREEKSIVRQILEGDKLGETEFVECSNCSKNIHGGEDVVVAVEETNNGYTVEIINCGGCGNRGLESARITARGRTGLFCEHRKNKPLLELFRVSDVAILPRGDML